MPNPHDRHPANAPGPVYVDDSCICCSACIACAPEHFDELDDQVVCVTQPTTPEEAVACRDAARVCPVDAIGFDDAAG
ncbi:MAG: ferredoxin [Myxococcota bacterium]